ncbi:MAG: SDR family NAD(P)-dependent oxidoreductase [Bacteroidota bacterium]
MLVKNKVIVVTGAGNGIGRETVIQLVQKGARVAAVDLNNHFLDETKSIINPNERTLSLHVADISNRRAIDQLVLDVIAFHGQVDAVVNIAGIIQPFIKINDLTYGTIEHILNVNFYGTVYLTKSFMPLLLERPEAHILNVSSMGGFLPVPGQAVYGASKAAVKLFTEALSAELEQTRVGVTIVFPGAIETNITANSGVSIDIDPAVRAKAKSMHPSKAAGLIIEAIEKNIFRVVIGSDASFMDKLSRLAPVYAKNLISKKMAFLLNKKS